jgi:parallel beta-helix repeat protein
MSYAAGCHYTALPKKKRSVFRNAIAATLMLAGSVQTAVAADYYVDGANGLNTNAGTSEYPFQTPWKAWTVAVAGDTIHLKPTATYGPLWFGPTADRPAATGGAPGAPVTIRGTGTGSGMTKVSGKGSNFGLMLDNTAHVHIENLDVTAPGHGTLSGWSALYIKNSRHIDVRSNYAHDAGCAGIQTHHADYVRIIGNRVAGNAKVVYNNVFCSGISNYDNKDADGNTGVKMEVANNIIYGNTNVKPANCTGSCTNSDGNGIIIDDSRRLQTADKEAYLGATLVDNNVVFNNGGRGLSIYQSDNVTTRGNTFYHNNKDPDLGAWRPGEIHVDGSGGVKLYGNIAFSAGSAGTTLTGAHVAISIQNSSGAPVAVDYNLSFNPQNKSALHFYERNNSTTVTFGEANKWGNPQHVAASLDPAVADFRVATTSPALGYSSPAGTFPATDYLYTTRTSPNTAGAYHIAVSKASTGTKRPRTTK